VRLKTSAAEQGGIDEIRPVGGPDHGHVAPFGYPVQFREHRRHDRVGHARGRRPAYGSEGIEFVEEDDGRGCRPGPGEHVADTSFRLAHVLVQELCSFDGKEGGPCLMGDGPHHERLPGPRWAEEQDAAGWLYAQVLEPLRLGDRPYDRLREPLLDVGEVGDLLEAMGGNVAHRGRAQ
jgi:hypothetical protein